MNIEIKFVPNPGLYQSLQDSIAAESTKHRTISGAVRRLQRLKRKVEDMGKNMGQWGHISIMINDHDVEQANVNYMLTCIWYNSDNYYHNNPEEMFISYLDHKNM